MVIVSGIIHQERWFTTTNIDDNTLIAVPDNGCLNDVLSLEWLKHFEQFTIQRRHGKWRLLILDGYGSHGVQGFLDYCDHDITQFCLLPHTTHLLQLLDVVCITIFMRK
jgi:hypothetical protein